MEDRFIKNIFVRSQVTYAEKLSMKQIIKIQNYQILKS